MIFERGKDLIELISDAPVLQDAVVAGYEDFHRILGEAYSRATAGKGRERHAAGRPFNEQPIMTIGKRRLGFLLGQVEKKLDEADRMPHDRARNEYLDCIVYMAAAVLALDAKGDE